MIGRRAASGRARPPTPTRRLRLPFATGGPSPLHLGTTLGLRLVHALADHDRGLDRDQRLGVTGLRFALLDQHHPLPVGRDHADDLGVRVHGGRRPPDEFAGLHPTRSHPHEKRTTTPWAITPESASSSASTTTAPMNGIRPVLRSLSDSSI